MISPIAYLKYFEVSESFVCGNVEAILMKAIAKNVIDLFIHFLFILRKNYFFSASANFLVSTYC